MFKAKAVSKLPVAKAYKMPTKASILCQQVTQPRQQYMQVLPSSMPVKKSPPHYM
jgi:hypothetical protein